jgi:hypothetical protein
MQVVHVVEARHLEGRHRRHAEVVGHGGDGFLGQPALFVLGDDQRRHHGGLLLVGRILGDFAVDPAQRLGTQFS